MVNGYPKVFMIIRTYQNHLSALRQPGLFPCFLETIVFHAIWFIGKILQMSC